MENESKDREQASGISSTDLQLVDPGALTRSWNGQIGRVESFLKPKENGRSALEEIVGEKITPENTMFYICGWQGTIDGCMDYLSPRGFVTKERCREDGSYEIKYESYG